MAKHPKQPKGKLLNGAEVASYIKERQAKQVRSLGFSPRLVIIRSLDTPEIATYVRLKQRYGEDIGVEVEDIYCDQEELLRQIKAANEDETVDGIIVQLPISEPEVTDTVLQAVATDKDVDSLSKSSPYAAATPTAIMWLLAAYNIDIRGKSIAVVGQGRLVGVPLSEALEASGHKVTRCDIDTTDLKSIIENHEVIVSGVGKPDLIRSSWLIPGAVVVDAGTSSEGGQLVGDVESAARERNDISITPIKGGVGPLTIAALFENVLLSAQRAEGVD